MREFPSLEHLATHLVEHVLSEIDHEIGEGLNQAAKLVQKTARSEFGTCQPGNPPFPEWKELADSTKQDRVRQGFAPNRPLERTGELRDSIVREVGPTEAVIGSTSDLMPFHEFGTEHIPPRPVLGLALYQHWPEIQRLLGGAIASAFTGTDIAGDVTDPETGKVDSSMGYDLSE